jgi:hypothetical protein
MYHSAMAAEFVHGTTYRGDARFYQVAETLFHSISLWVKPIGYHWTLGQYVFAFGPIPKAV